MLSPVVSIVHLSAGGIDPPRQDVPLLLPLEVKRNASGDERLCASEVLDGQPRVSGPREFDGLRHIVGGLHGGVGEVDGGPGVGPGGGGAGPQDPESLDSELQRGPGL